MRKASPWPRTTRPPPDSLGTQCIWTEHLPSTLTHSPRTHSLSTQGTDPLLSPLHFRSASSYVECLSDPNSQHLKRWATNSRSQLDAYRPKDSLLKTFYFAPPTANTRKCKLIL